MNAGSSIGINGPLTLSLTPLMGENGFYTGNSASSLPAGSYTISNGTGGSDVGAFVTTLQLPQPLNWTNQTSITNIPRSQPLTVTWRGGDANSYAVITGASSSSVTSGVGAAFTCTAPVSAGQFTIPAAVLLSLPASTNQNGIPGGSLSVGSFSNPSVFTATGLDYAFTAFGSISSGFVTYQ